MVKMLVVLVAGGLVMASFGCNMFRAWKAIPPPGGCDQCHTVPISANWAVSYTPVALNDERGRPAFQTEGYTMPATERQGTSSLDLRKTEEQRCFECHKAPNQAHKGKSGRFHH